MKKVIIATALSAVASAHLFAADSIEGAFAAGKTTGEISAFYNSTDNKTGDDSSIAIGSLNLLYSTDSYHGLKANVGMRTNMLINEKNDADYDNDADKVVVNVANLEYSRGIGTLIAGRQSIALEWIGDYHNAVVGVLSANGMTLTAGYTDSKAVTDPDAPLAKFSDIGEDGAYVVDAVYDLGHAKVNAYYMTADTVYNADGALVNGFSAVGGKIEGSAMGINVVAKYAQTKEDVVDTPDGDIMAFEAGYSTDAFGVKAGYIATDKSGGIGSLAALGDNINLFDTGNAVYGTDAKTYYVGANTSVAGFDLGALYGSTKYDSYTNTAGDTFTNGTEKELNLTVGKELAKNFKATVLYADISAESSADDSSYISAQLTYSF